MQQELSLKTAFYQVRHKHRRIWKRILWILSSVVVFVTTYALILPAITLETEYICGYETHIHEDACYQPPELTVYSSLICTSDTLGVHNHTSECYNESGEPKCGIADFVLHTHDAACFDANGDLVCPLSEIQEHIHDETCRQQPHVHLDTCYVQQRGQLLCTVEEGSVHTHVDTCFITQDNLTCTLPESAPHTHTTESCYTETKDLLCTEPEVAPHAHSDSCYTAETTKICAEEEGENHTHTDACFQTTSIFTCTLMETAGHVHSDACYSEPVYTLTCTTEQTEGHTHDTTCYETVRVVTCALEEGIAHVHTDSCYVCTPVLQCTESFVEECTALTCEKKELFLHTHESACFDQSGACICGLLEISEHIHGDTCFAITMEQATEPVLSCGFEEHEHSEACIVQEESSDGTFAEGTYCNTIEHTHRREGEYPCFDDGNLMCTIAEHAHEELCYLDPEKRDEVDPDDDWRDALPEEDALTGEIAADLITVAQLQLDYCQSAEYYTVTDEDEILYYSRYADWWSYGQNPYGGWNAMLVSFCLKYAEAGMELYDDPALWAKDLFATDLWLRAGSTPVASDLVFFDNDGDGTADRVGIITAVSKAAGTFDAILERRGMVQQVTYDLDDTDILGYGMVTGEVSDPTVDPMVERVNTMIEALPTAEEADTVLMAYEDAGDMEGYEVYFRELAMAAESAFAIYEELTVEQRAAVVDVEKLFDLSWCWQVRTMALTSSVTVTAVNAYATPAIIVHAGREAPSGNTYTYWKAVVVEENDAGFLYVEKIVADQSNKRVLTATTANGFVLLTYNLSYDVSVNDPVTVSFDYKNTNGTNSSGFGEVRFGSTGTMKPAKDNSDKLNIVPSADTDELIEVNLYNYGSNINTLYSGNNKYPGFQQEGGESRGDYLHYSNFGNNVTEDRDAGINGLTNQGGDINATENGANSPISGAILGTLKDGYPALADGTSLEYLFSDGTYADKKNTQNINGLFQHNEVTGAYTFNSRENHAQYSNNRFTLYEEIITPNFTLYPFGNFLPFSDIVHDSAQVSTIDRNYLLEIQSSAQYKADAGYDNDFTTATPYATLASSLNKWINTMDAEYDSNWNLANGADEYFAAIAAIPNLNFNENQALLNKAYCIDYDEPKNFFFGMEMKMNFMMPKNGMTGNDTNGDGESDYPMVFEFSGDDDVWVYVDGVLFLDLSGIHRHVGGTIDFSEGIVTYQSLDPGTGDVGEPYKTVTFAEILGSTTALNANGTFKDYSQHTFNFYYMERGAGSGVCRMNFNFPLLKQNTINVSKAVESTADIQGDPDYKFQVLRANADNTKTENLFIGAGVDYTIYDLNNKVIGTGTTDTNGVFTLKAGQRAEFDGIDENDGKYYVRELLEGTVLEQYGKITVSGEFTTTSNNVTVGSDTFTGADSPVKDISDGTTAFLFTNHVDVNKLGDLSIRKKLSEYPKSRAIRYYDIEVMLDGEKLPVGTVYTVGDQTRTVNTAGIITIAADETAKISDILAGTQFTVQETGNSAAGYIVSYTSADSYPIEVKDGKATGTIITDANVQLVVTNSEKGASVTFPITKTVVNHDGTPRDYRFNITQVEDYTGATEINGTQTEITIHADNFGNTTYTLNFVQTTGVFYYRITEVNEETVFRENAQTYVIQVTVEEDPTADNGAAATITGIWKDGTQIAYAEGDSFSADFTNTLVGSLTLSKEVVGTTPEGGFTFEVQLKNGDTPVSGTFPVSIGEPVTFTDGVSNVTLKAGESITIYNIPYGTTWAITETNADGYVVTYTVNDEDVQSGAQSTGGIIVGDTEVAYTNSAMYELPETGGGGAMAYRLMGSGMLLTLPILYAIKGRYRGRRVKGG